MDTTLFEQVIVNILKNAAESIEVHGNIYIQTTSSPVTLEIADTGAGISREVEARLFSPFFSTKPNGQGIGLIFIRDVLIKHGCTFSLRTWPDGLTRFLIRFLTTTARFSPIDRTIRLQRPHDSASTTARMNRHMQSHSFSNNFFTTA